ncbi:nucleotidyltransferase domain-containing protein [Methanolapillus ohkumae]|uniref:Polymerase nucleotidyl transferase domain-containing protein n=1 Tax=Methanolapillus ohkumae TaxID=3028298 RepID=A0AA96ZVH6_9EURY|nr:hypothetical protein MsAm2_04920 [Methanosarcinaceae archaeon Am2]
MSFAYSSSDPVLRDFFITKDGLIFSVPDYFHPKEGIRSILRYVPDPAGERVLRGTNHRYKKMGFEESFQFVKDKYPDWVSEVILVPRGEISKILKPTGVVHDILLGKIKNPAALEIICCLEQQGIPASSMGISGSVLAGLENESSDIDLVVYGNNWEKARSILTSIKKNQPQNQPQNQYQNQPQNQNQYQNQTSRPIISELDDAMWHTVYDKRKSPLSFEDFFRHEIRKENRGMIQMNEKTVYFDLLFARTPDQIQKPPARGMDTKKMEIEAIVTDAKYAFDSPAIYEIDHPEISEIFSYTHTYAGQALQGEHVRARGMVEQIGDKKRLVIGTTREAVDEWMISLSLLEK